MKTENGQSTVHTNQMSHESSLSSSFKYDGLLKTSFGKQIRNSIAILYAFMVRVENPLAAMHLIISCFRLFQFFGASFVCSNSLFWKKNDLTTQTIGYISIFFHLVPAQFREQHIFTVQIVLSLILFLFTVILLASGFYFKKRSQISHVVAQLLSLFVGTLGYLLPVIDVQFMGEGISYLIMHQSSATVFNIFSVIFSFIIVLIYYLLNSSIFVKTIVFKPNSLKTIFSKTQTIIFLFSLVITFTSSLSSYLPPIFSGLICFISALLCLLEFFLIGNEGSLIEPTQEKGLFSMLFGSLLNYCIVGICLIIGYQCNFIIFIILMASAVLFAFISIFFTEHRRRKALSVLDIFAETGNVAHLKSKKMAAIGSIGMQYGHEACLDWSFFNHLVQLYPKDPSGWIVFAKFVAIYPEESRTLEWICRTMVSSQFKGSTIKIAVEQIQSILRQRESNLSSSLKRKLNTASKLINHCKQKQRQIWDLVLQGNTGDLEMAIKVALNSLEKCQNQFQKILMEYPNNRFITRVYSRYLRECEANYSESHVQIENMKLLQRGQAINLDPTNVLGLLSFPLMPRSLNHKKEQSSLETEISGITLEDNLDGEEQGVVLEQYEILKKQVKSLRIPVVTISRFTALVLFIGFIMIPVAVFILLTSNFEQSLIGPLQHIYNAARIRTIAYQITQLIIQQTMQNLPVKDDPSKTLFTKPIVDGLPMKYWCGERTVVGMLECVRTRMVDAIQNLNYFREFDSNDEYLQKAASIIFNPKTEFYYYENSNTFVVKNSSVQEMVTDYLRQAVEMITIGDNVTPANLATAMMLNPQANIKAFMEAFDTILDYFEKSVVLVKTQTDQTYTIIEIALPILITLIIVIWIYYINRLVNSNSSEIYHAMITIPKSNVSAISEQFKLIRKETDGSKSGGSDCEVSRQEDYAIKLFTSFGDEDGKNGGKTILFTATVLLIISGIVSYVLVAELYKNEVSIYQKNAPHLNRLFGAYGYGVAAIIPMSLIYLSLEGYKEIDLDPYYMVERIYQRSDRMVFYYHGARFGSSELHDIPFIGISDGNAHAEAVLKCGDRLKIPTKMSDVYNCMNADTQVNFISAMLRKLMENYNYGVKQRRSYENEISELKTLTLIVVYETYFAYMFQSITDNIEQDIVGVVPMYGGLIGVTLAIGFVGIIGIFLYTFQLAKHLKYTLSLLQFCHPSVLLGLPRIVDVLNGKFGKNNKESTTRTNEFFTSLVDNMLDGILMTNQQNIITCVNQRAVQLFDIPDLDELIENKQNLADFIKKYVFVGNLGQFINSSDNTAVNSNANSNNINNSNTSFYGNNPNGNGNELDIVMKKQDNTEVSLHLTKTIGVNGSIYSIRDITQSIKHKALIAEEKLKSDKLLSSILPASLVPRVQAGEVNISFAVQSASILFLDIVEFTPWCSSNTAQTVMSTLNTMFSRLDMLVSSHQTLTKIKCIGDCYMAAGGIFSSINQPSVHAREMVEFGLEAIEMLNQMDKEFNLDRKIRVGINTGGPIVAGVIGIGKPTFEILGPTINMAQQMEHHGVPMQVHISRATYEIIYGGNFIVKERGETKIKNDNVQTYLVTGMKNEK